MKKSFFSINKIITYVVVCVTLFSSCLLAGIYAKYTSISESSGSVGVVEFNITQEGTIFENIVTTVTPGTTQSAKLKIINSSEVAVKYTISIKNVTSNMPHLEFKLVPVGASTPAVTSEVKNGVNIYSASQTQGEHTDIYDLQIVWNESDTEEKDLAYMGMVDYITITVTATQNDTRG